MTAVVALASLRYGRSNALSRAGPCLRGTIGMAPAPNGYPDTWDAVNRALVVSAK
jgi:hypothetical protein